MEQTILRSKVYDALQSGEPFDMQFITCDRRRGTGGELITVENWMKVQKEPSDHGSGPGSAAPSTPSKKCCHEANGTVNIYNPANAGTHIITVHLDLIMFFNGKRVIN